MRTQISEGQGGFVLFELDCDVLGRIHGEDFLSGRARQCQNRGDQQIEIL